MIERAILGLLVTAAESREGWDRMFLTIEAG
jgi:hypothetical protein